MSSQGPPQPAIPTTQAPPGGEAEHSRDRHLPKPEDDRARWEKLNAQLLANLQQTHQIDDAYRWAEIALHRHVSALEVADRRAAAAPDIDRKFESFEDAWDRLSVYHVHDTVIPGHEEDAEFREIMSQQALEYKQQAFELDQRYLEMLQTEADSVDAVDHLGLLSHAITVEHQDIRENERRLQSVAYEMRKLEEERRRLQAQLEQERLQRLREAEEQRIREEQERRAQEAARFEEDQKKLMQMRLDAMRENEDYF